MKKVLTIALCLFSLSAFSQQDTTRRASVVISYQQAQAIYYYVDHAKLEHNDVEEMKKFLDSLFAKAFAEEPKKIIDSTDVKKKK